MHDLPITNPLLSTLPQCTTSSRPHALTLRTLTTKTLEPRQPTEQRTNTSRLSLRVVSDYNHTTVTLALMCVRACGHFGVFLHARRVKVEFLREVKIVTLLGLA